MEFSKEEKVSEIRYEVHLKITSRDFPGDLAVKNPPSGARAEGPILLGELRFHSPWVTEPARHIWRGLCDGLGAQHPGARSRSLKLSRKPGPAAAETRVRRGDPAPPPS